MPGPVERPNPTEVVSLPLIEVRSRTAQAMADGKLASVARSMLADDEGHLDDVAVAELGALLAAVESVDARCRAAELDLVDELGRVGVAARAVEHDEPRQLLSIDVEVEAGQLIEAAAALEGLGYRGPGWSPGGWTVARRADGVASFVADGDDPIRLGLRWGAPSGASRRRTTRWSTPTPRDLTAVALPRQWWFGYYLVRPVRVVLDRVRAPRAPSLGPHLRTPPALIDPLLDLAEVVPDDRVVDLGCGDGRVVLAAARRGCPTLGVELDPDLARAAASRVEAAELDADVVVGDALEADLREATVVFLFLPPALLRRALPVVLAQLGPGGRVIAHEQLALHAEPPPAEVVPMAVGDAITTARLWRT